jgi:hypothetical protein
MSGKNGALTAAEIHACDTRPLERVEVPEWGGHVFVRTMGGNERDEFDLSFVDEDTGKRNLAGIRARVAVACVCDANGKRLFTNTQDLEKLSIANGAALDRVFEIAGRLNRLTEKDIKDLVGNSSGAPSATSGSRSQPAKAGRSPKPSAA